MNKEEKRKMKELVWRKMFTVLTAITNTSDPEQDKYAAEAAYGLTNILLNLQLVKPDPDKPIVVIDEIESEKEKNE